MWATFVRRPQRYLLKEKPGPAKGCAALGSDELRPVDEENVGVNNPKSREGSTSDRDF